MRPQIVWVKKIEVKSCRNKEFRIVGPRFRLEGNCSQVIRNATVIEEAAQDVDSSVT